MSAEEIINEMKKMENRERNKFLSYLMDEHFCVGNIEEAEAELLIDIRAGLAEVIYHAEI